MPDFISPDDVPALLAPGMTVYVAGGANEPATVLDALRRRPAASAGVTWIQSIVPALNRFDFCSLHDEARAIAFFITPETRASYRAGRVDFIPCQLRAVADLLEEGLDIDLAIMSVSAPPDGAREDAADFGAGLKLRLRGRGLRAGAAGRRRGQLRPSRSPGRASHRGPRDRLRGAGVPPPGPLSSPRAGRDRPRHRPQRRHARPRRRHHPDRHRLHPVRGARRAAERRTTSGSTPGSSTTG